MICTRKTHCYKMVLDVKSLERLKKAVVFEEPLNKVDQSVLDIFEVQKGPKLLPP